MIQRLGNQATKLNAEQALLQPHSTVWTALTAAIPWKDSKVTTRVLNQKGHRLARAGFLQARKRPGRAEADILLLAPALDTPSGHPAIWEKLLSQYVHEAAQQGIMRIYVDVPDQPLPVSSISHVGFQVYARQTIWRLQDYGTQDRPALSSAVIRPARTADDWALEQLYYRVTPSAVQQAEAAPAENGGGAPIFYCGHAGMCQRFVLEEAGLVTSCLQITRGARGTWWTLWTDMLQPDGHQVRELLRFGLRVARADSLRYPIYVGVREYHGAMASILGEYGFAPFTDRALMVKQLLQWVHQTTLEAVPTLEHVGEIMPTPFALPGRANRKTTDH